MDKILVYGGTFNPIHNGHLHLAASFEKITGAQRVLLVPTRVPPHKQAKELACEEDRLAMCRLAVKPFGWRVSDLEIRRESPSYTADTLEQLSALYPKARLYFLTGEDMFMTLLSWYDPIRILRSATICAAPRSTSGLAQMLAYAVKIRQAGGEALVRDVSYLPVSSTQVRRAVREKQTVHTLVPPAVESYIAQHSLYGEPD
ncbi:MULTISPECIES: nicotinate (nicotinamide) nucleotide adenylyltransferase [Caproicibacterium]|uniref:Probable nicotinate-nucleotide adenylyltransferase n=1 Tax=Caproicibacterium argilliputei TaxID=3030016 RepID=A0AA97DDP2_9FIRM|nr:nicotinate (nicotinamide) nucleotide adenylyltransferase [Caproicibacterium argilliputei]WOC33531.1 nicotinate (nicotinamide) nucleotide adenylyltransferase [Caproicibacterium argilliputei]